MGIKNNDGSAVIVMVLGMSLLFSFMGAHLYRTSYQQQKKIIQEKNFLNGFYGAEMALLYTFQRDSQNLGFSGAKAQGGSVIIPFQNMQRTSSASVTPYYNLDNYAAGVPVNSAVTSQIQKNNAYFTKYATGSLLAFPPTVQGQGQLCGGFSVAGLYYIPRICITRQVAAAPPPVTPPVSPVYVVKVELAPNAAVDGSGVVKLNARTGVFSFTPGVSGICDYVWFPQFIPDKASAPGVIITNSDGTTLTARFNTSGNCTTAASVKLPGVWGQFNSTTVTVKYTGVRTTGPSAARPTYSLTTNGFYFDDHNSSQPYAAFMDATWTLR